MERMDRREDVARKFTIEDLEGCECKKQGFPKTYVVKKGKKEDKWIYVKEFKNKESALAVKEAWDGANAKEIPTPKYGILQLGTRYFFWSEPCKGKTFFKAASDAIIIRWLNKQTDIAYLVKLKEIFKNHKIGDAQGFFEDKENGAIEFIDLGNSMVEVPQMQQYIPTVNERIIALGGKVEEDEADA